MRSYVTRGAKKKKKKKNAPGPGIPNEQTFKKLYTSDVTWRHKSALIALNT